MSDYINEGAEIFNEPKKKKGFTPGKLFKFLALVVIVAVYGVLMARCVMSNDAPLVKEVLVDEAFLSAYNADKENFTVQKYGIENSWAAIREGRLLEFNHLYYVPSVKQLQFSVKFNTDLPLCEYDEEIPFKFSLRDENGNEFLNYRYKYTEKFGFGYIRLCFNGIELEDKSKTDENGDYLRHKYTLYVQMIDKNGDYNTICAASIYNGAKASRPVDFKPVLN